MKKILYTTFVTLALALLFSVPVIASEFSVAPVKANQVESWSSEDTSILMFGSAPPVTSVFVSRPVVRNGRFESVVTVQGNGWHTTRVSGGLQTPRVVNRQMIGSPIVTGWRYTFDLGPARHGDFRFEATFHSHNGFGSRTGSTEWSHRW